ncbi:MAG: hypothetical protein Q9218_006343 [Villophora microphyllina]
MAADEQGDPLKPGFFDLPPGKPEASDVLGIAQWRRGTEYEPLYPEILSTCRKIWQEAVPILYRENNFAFWTDELHISIKKKVHKAKEACKALMTVDPKEWITSVPIWILWSTLAAFLRMIGPVNAGLIRSLILRTRNTHSAIDDLIVVTELCGKHMGGLEQFKLYIVWNGAEYWEDSKCYCRQCGRAPPPLFTNFEGMCRFLGRFVLKVHWLKKLEFDMAGQLKFGDRDALDGIRGLELLVQKRELDRQSNGEWGKRIGIDSLFRNDIMRGDDEGLDAFWYLCKDS